MSHWDSRFLKLAEHVASWSKDPSTKTGAVIVDPFRRLVSLGYNGFARGVNDTHDRLTDRNQKYPLTVHCEVNAVLFARRDLRGHTLYTWPFMSCAACASVVIQAGITRCVAPVLPPTLAERWGQSIVLSKAQFAEAGVELVEV